MDRVSFAVRADPAYTTEWVQRIEPVIDRVLLRDRIAAFEAEQGFEPAGGYGGIIPSFAPYGDLVEYFLGRPEPPFWRREGKIALLGCGDCGEAGCWPLYADVEVVRDTVVWSGFEQPFRPERNYGNFGAFRFEVQAYREALADALGRLEQE